jgi:nickel-type superoxide dismutase maturation protease
MGVEPPSGSDGPPERTYHRARGTRKRALAATAFSVVAAWGFLRWKPFRVEIVGASMRPTLEPGEWVLAVAASRFRRGDVVVLEHPVRPGFELVKRIVAVPGDLGPDGHVLDADAFWVEGDAPDASTDSRSFGPVPRGSLLGTVRVVYHPFERRRRV